MHIPEDDRIGLEVHGLKSHFFGSCADFGVWLAACRDAGQIPLDIRYEYRGAELGKLLRQYLQGYCLACAGGPGDQPVAIDHARLNGGRLCSGSEQDRGGVLAHEFILIQRPGMLNLYLGWC